MLKKRLCFVLLLLCLAPAPLLAKEWVIGTDTSFMPFEFKQGNRYVGFDIDLWAAIAQKLGLTYRLQPMDFNGLIPALQSGSIDVGLAGMTIQPQREKVVDFSQPYYRAGLQIMVRAKETGITKLNDLKNKAVAVKLGTTSANFIQGKAAKVRLFPRAEETYMELLIGGVDAVIHDRPALEYYANTLGKGQVKLVGPLYAGQNYGIAFPKGSPLLEPVNRVLAEMKQNGTYAKLYQKWFGKKPPTH